jgi:hypothetical protein
LKKSGDAARLRTVVLRDTKAQASHILIGKWQFLRRRPPCV